MRDGIVLIAGVGSRSSPFAMSRYLFSCLVVLAVLLASGSYFFRNYWEHRHDELISRQARIYRLDERLVWSLIYEETWFRETAIGDAD